MSVLSSIVATLLVATAVAPPPAPQGTVALPEAVLAHPAAQSDLSQQAPAPPRWSQQALATWPGPWGVQPGFRDRPDSYDHQYMTW
jgi:hypothetical protein